MLDNRGTESRFSPIDEISETIAKKFADVRPADEKPEQKPKGVKTRFLGFGTSAKPATAEQCENPVVDPETPSCLPTLARLVVIEGAGRGKSFPITESFSRIGRGADQEVQLAFGDSTISRESHATIVHYGEQNGFVIRDGLRVNPVLLNNRTVRGDAALKTGDHIRIGETVLSFEAFGK